MGFKYKTYGLNHLVILKLQTELQIQKDFPTCFVTFSLYKSYN